jgi:hypothetical protein
VLSLFRSILLSFPSSWHNLGGHASNVARSQFSAGANGMLDKSLHFPIKPGVVAAWNARTVVIVAPSDGSSTRVRDVATGEDRDVPVDELGGIPAIGC